MNADTTITLDRLHVGIETSIRSKFPDLGTVAAYFEDRKALKVEHLPAFLFELTEMDPAGARDPGTGQLAVLAKFEGLVVMPFKIPGSNSKREVRKLVGTLATFAQNNGWGCPIGPAVVTAVAPDEFNPDLNQFEVWRLDWQQVIHLGESVWPDAEGAVPTQVMLSQLPDVGLGHEADYVVVTAL